MRLPNGWILLVSLGAGWLSTGRSEEVPLSPEAVELPLGVPAMMETPTPSGAPEVAQRLIPFPFLPPDVVNVGKESLSKENNWFTKRDKREIDELGRLDFHAESGTFAVALVPKLHNTSAGLEIYRIPEGGSIRDFEQREGAFRPGRTSEFLNPRSAEKIAKFKMGEMGECGIAYFYLSRILGKLVEVPPATYRTLHIDEFRRAAKQSHQTGNPACTYSWSVLRQQVGSEHPRFVLPGGEFVFGSIAENPRGEDSSPPGYWTLDRIRQKRFYRVLSSRDPVAETLDLADPAYLQDLALAQDLARGVILDEIFRQADRLGNISIGRLGHYINREGMAKWKDNLDEEDEAERITRVVDLDRILYKDNDDGMMWGERSISVSPVLEEARHLDPVVYSRLQWLAALMQDAEGGAAEVTRQFFLEVVRMTPRNYESLGENVIKIAERLKGRVDSGQIRLDLDFEGTLKQILLQEAADGGANP